MKSDYEETLSYLTQKYVEVLDRIDAIKLSYEFELPIKEKLLIKLGDKIANWKSKI